MDYPGLDDAFLRYIQATPENERRIQSFYVPFFRECQGQVVDLACGHGDFVQLLTEQGIDAVGVDSDSACCAETRRRGVNVVCRDVIDYLRQVEENSLGGIFSAHLVEHLPYQTVMEMIRLSYRTLKPGGIILLVTPNARSAYAHLESFYKHFGHVSFYHPELLCFFLDYFGFAKPRAGENPRVAAPLWGESSLAMRRHTDVQPWQFFPRLTYERMLPLSRDNLLRRAVRGVKMFLVRMIVQPYIDQLVARLSEWGAGMNVLAGDVYRMQATLDCAVECYAYAYKPASQPDMSQPANS
jgi:SAM-dependent methyltransferase